MIIGINRPFARVRRRSSGDILGRLGQIVDDEGDIFGG
jgi:hypothetical protein